MNWAIIAANVIMFIVERALWPENQPYALQPRNPHLLHYFTYQFLHASPLHLGGNMLFLYIFGNNVNDRIGHLGYLAFYLAGGVAAGIGHMLSSSSSVIGASGSVSAVTGAYLVLLPRSHVTILYWFYLIGTIELPSVYFIIFSFVMDFAMGFGGGETNIAHTAHISGSVFGFGVTFTLLSLGLLPRDPFDLFALFKQWNRRRQYKDLVQQGFDPFNAGPRNRNTPPDPNMGRIQDLRAQISEALARHEVEDAARIYLELHAIDSRQVLSRHNQLDVANQLFAAGVYPAAAEAYERFLQYYPKHDQIEQVYLVLGLLYSRYLNHPDRARQYLSAALERLNDPRQIELAKHELQTVTS